MPVSKQAKKRMYSDRRKHKCNTAVISRIKTLKKKYANTEDVDAATTQASVVIREADKAASKGIIPKKRAARIKSRTAKRLNKLKTVKAS